MIQIDFLKRNKLTTKSKIFKESIMSSFTGINLCSSSARTPSTVSRLDWEKVYRSRQYSRHLRLGTGTYRRATLTGLTFGPW